VTAKNILAIATAAIATAGLAACGNTGAVGRLGELKRAARTCPAHAHLAAYVAWDVRRTLRGPRIAAVRLESLQQTAERVAVCGGALRVVAFGATASSTARLLDAELRPPGATENARLLRVPHLVAQVKEHVEQALPGVLAEVSGRGADPLTQFAAADQFRRQLGPGYALHLVIETSGLVRDAPTRKSLAAAASASELTADTAAPNLRGTEVVVAGIGKIGRGAPMPSRAVEALRVFYGKVCERTHADACLVISDLAPLGG